MADSFWDSLGPGLLQTGGNLFLQNRANKEAEDRLKRAQGPLYNQLMTQAGSSLSLAGGFDPKAHAAARFEEQQALLAPGQEADRQRMMRELQAKGMLGAASFSPVAGTVATPGQPMNPHMAALLAAQEGAKSKASYDSLREGEAYLDNLLKRSGTLQSQAQTARSTGRDAMRGIPAKPTAMEMLVKGGMNLMKDPKARGELWELVKQVPSAVGGLFGADDMQWLRPTTIPMQQSAPFYSAADLSDFFM